MTETKTELETLPDEDTVIDQAFDIPVHTKIQLWTMKTNYLLRNPEDFNKWKFSITWVLQQYQALKIIDKKVDRPKQSDAGGLNWMHASLRIGEWLKRCIHHTLRERIDPSSKLRFADEIFEAIEKEMGRSLLLADGKYALVLFHMIMSLDEYKSTKKYVEEVRRLVLIVSKRGLDFSPYTLWATIIGQVGKRYPDLAKQESHKFIINGKSRDTFNGADLLQYIDELIVDLEKLEWKLRYPRYYLR